MKFKLCCNHHVSMVFPSYKKRTLTPHWDAVICFSLCLFWVLFALSQYSHKEIHFFHLSIYPSIHLSIHPVKYSLLSSYCNFKLHIRILSAWRRGIKLQPECLLALWFTRSQWQVQKELPLPVSQSTVWVCWCTPTQGHQRCCFVCPWECPSYRHLPPSGTTHTSPAQWGLPWLFFLKLPPSHILSLFSAFFPS